MLAYLTASGEQKRTRQYGTITLMARLPVSIDGPLLSIRSVVRYFRSGFIPSLLLNIFYRPAENSRGQFNGLALFDRTRKSTRSIVDHGFPSLGGFCFAIARSRQL